MNKKHTRDFKTKVECRAEQEEKTIEGYFALFNDETELYPGIFESIDPQAFNNTLQSDVRGLINHDTSKVLGRTKSNTLELTVDNKGLYGKIKINEKDQEALNLYERVRRGDIDQCSFGFTIQDEEVTYGEDDTAHYRIKDLELFEVSVCTFPAYKNTGVEARQEDLERHNKKKLELEKQRLKERLTNA